MPTAPKQFGPQHLGHFLFDFGSDIGPNRFGEGLKCASIPIASRLSLRFIIPT